MHPEPGTLPPGRQELSMTDAANVPGQTGFHIDRGTCFVLFAYNIARSVDLT